VNKAVFLMMLLFVVMASCGDEVVVKPPAHLRLDYPEPQYADTRTGCAYEFSFNSNARVDIRTGCDINVVYPGMKATIYLTYIPVNDSNLTDLLRDAQKLTYDHTVKANEILEQPRVDPENKVFGMYYMINGDAATQSQFYVTDSVRHFVTGSLYFEAKPNFDSIFPAVVYLREDIRRIMETISWKDSP
jgi:gliding motility-associated lipoprotein GldD